MSKRDSPAKILAKDLIAGCFGGIGIVAVGHPFDTVKVHILFEREVVPCKESLTYTFANSECS